MLLSDREFLRKFLVDSVVLMSLRGEKKKLRMCPSPTRQLTFSRWLWTTAVMSATQSSYSSLQVGRTVLLHRIKKSGQKLQSVFRL